MLASLLSLRIKQLLRVISSVGVPLLIIATLVLSGISFQFIGSILSFSHIWVVPLAFLFIYYLHLVRKDKRFLSDIAASVMHARLAMSAEYLIVLLPVIIFQVYNYHFFNVLGLVTMPLVVNLLPSFKIIGFRDRIVNLSFIPIEVYELRIIIERYFPLFLVCWLVAFLGFLHVAYFLVALLFGLTILIGAYMYNEPLELMYSYRNFLQEKLLVNLGFCGLLFLPQFLIAFFCNPESYLVLAYGCMYFFTMLALAIVYKYAKYNPVRSSTLNSTLVGVSMVLGLMPGLVIGSIILVVYYYFAAQKNLNYHLC